MGLIKFVLVMFACEIVIGAEGARILAYYPCPSLSHQVVFRPITLELLKRGHQVTVVTPDPMFSEDNRPANLTEIDVHDVSYDNKRDYTQSVSGNQDDVLFQTEVLMEFQLNVFIAQFESQQVKDLLTKRSGEYDLVLLEAFFIPILGLTHTFDAPTILVSSFGAFSGNYETVGVSTNPFLYPEAFRQRLYNLAIWEKITEVLNYIRIKNIMSRNEDKLDELLPTIFGPDIPSMSVLRNNVDMLLLNINPIWEGNYPVPPNVIHTGGLHMKPPQDLPEDLQEYLDASEAGVIYFSLGTNVMASLLPPEKIAIIENVFSQLPYNVIWKWDHENFDVKSRNIKIVRWLPQADFLKHPNVKVFITQGGLQSTDEAIAGGVPLIGIPMLGDQWYNVEKYVHNKIGVRLDIQDLTEDRLKAAILEVAEVESYRNNIKSLRSMMQDQPQAPLEKAVWWIEYVLRHGGAKHLRAPAANMSWTEFLELELIGLILITALITSGLIFSAVKFITSHIFKNRSISKSKTS